KKLVEMAERQMAGK
ncbi:hypothetical protein, partial [Clostridioides difficile]